MMCIEWLFTWVLQNQTNVITLANHKGHWQFSKPIKIRSKHILAGTERGKTCVFCKTISGRSNAKPNQMRITFHFQLKPFECNQPSKLEASTYNQENTLKLRHDWFWFCSWWVKKISCLLWLFEAHCICCLSLFYSSRNVKRKAKYVFSTIR